MNVVNRSVLLSVMAMMLGAAGPPNDRAVSPKAKRSSTYISVESARGRHSRLDATERHFQIFSVAGTNRDPDDDSHDGGVIRVEEHQDFYDFGVGLYIPKAGVETWRAGELTCQRTEISADAYVSMCKRDSSQRQFTSVVSKSRGVLSFTGHCWITESKVCQYVLISSEGIPTP